MTPNELRKHCEQQIALVPGQKTTVEIGLCMRGSWGKRGVKRLWPGGPNGKIVAETGPNEVMVFFNARDVLDALAAVEGRNEEKDA